MAKQMKVTWIKSAIGQQQRHRRTVRALGLRRLHQTVVKEDSPQMRGMLHAVRHMVHVEEVEPS